MKQKKKQEWYAEYPKRPFFIHPKKYDELFIVLPICFVMFFLKDGGWAYSILLFISWMVIAIHWSKVIWIDECNKKGMYKLYYDGEWMNNPEAEDFHDDPPTHKRDELHYVYDRKNKKWESHEEVRSRLLDESITDPYVRRINTIALEKIELANQDLIQRGF